MEKEKVMIVEDEFIVALDIAGQLERLGFSCLYNISSGEEAVEKAKNFRPDLVLMDIGLKGRMDGIEAAHEIRKDFNIPIVFLTAYSDEKMLARAKKTGDSAFLTKPIQKEELHSTIEVALHKGKLGA